ncbi:tyrosine protein kinase [Burkholderia aenigmatica]|uniref:non-specific protein-tyrosine kinase n=1 Tax=Burkholderia aenigmatica TaxID=2015348 RepID=A0ABY6XSQ6_9BURK|nr:tyrosine protein kinase [Burkholderia aenigmatica]VWC83927.1 tyrosine protein kinase [Burkholderia aenigmatica]
MRPKRPFVIAAAALIGLAFGIALAFARDFLFGGVRHADDIERHLDIDVYATIPDSAAQRQMVRRITQHAPGPNLLSARHPHDPAVESLRSLRTALRFAMQGARNNVLLLTGPAPGAGKSFVAANFAALLAANGERVLLVDGDLRKGHLHDSFGVPRERGFTELLSGTVAPADVTHRDVVPHLDFIPTGAVPAHPSELLADARVAALLDTLSARYDVVVIDAAPILAVTDAVMLGRHAGTVLLAARAASTRVAELGEAVRRLAHNGVAASGVLLNGVDPHIGRYGSRYGAYRYTQYRYAPSRCSLASSIGRTLRALVSRHRGGPR